MTVPSVAAFSASCSAKGTGAPRPATSAGSSPARVTGVTAACTVPAHVRAPTSAATTTIPLRITSPPARPRDLTLARRSRHAPAPPALVAADVQQELAHVCAVRLPEPELRAD